MATKVLIAYIIADILFVSMGALELAFSIIVSNLRNEVGEGGQEVARNLLYRMFPLTAGIVNAVFIFITFAITIPAMVTPTRSWLKISGIMTAVCAVFTMIVGIYLWVLTLTMSTDNESVWVMQTPDVQSQLQTEFKCCGYFNSTSPAFVTNPTCPSPAASALMRGCSSPVATFMNIFINDIFTVLFGVVAVDILFILASACLHKERREQERFAHIDAKSGI